MSLSDIIGFALILVALIALLVLVVEGSDYV